MIDVIDVIDVKEEDVDADADADADATMAVLDVLVISYSSIL